MASQKALCFLLVLLLITVQGFAKRCKPSSITASVTKTGRVVGGLPEWDVVINNTCKCPQTDVVLNCVGFSAISAQADPKIFLIVGNLCLVNDGKPITKGEPVKFKVVVKEPPSELSPALSVTRCP
ncbi:uncharacterized protein LOC131326564 [Rhododendron vialii]|uniref:uncharacterized protein LOC131326564 n=1 Tax=Rhododendron vialii TaxID=182163 RepID=UPI00265DCEC2|nr:uncharacterized protein LOC131326564 [Rhododendron vialii]